MRFSQVLVSRVQESEHFRFPDSDEILVPFNKARAIHDVFVMSSTYPFPCEEENHRVQPPFTFSCQLIREICRMDQSGNSAYDDALRMRLPR